MEEIYRSLHNEEIVQLVNHNCICENWYNILVAERFRPENIRNTYFSGNIKLGVFSREFTFPGGMTVTSGIYNSIIHNCTIGNDVYIHNINNYLANYIIEDEVVIDNVGLISVEGNSSFGNGIIINPLNEAGGRTLPIFDYLSSQLAHILVFYKYKPVVISHLEDMIAAYAESVSSGIGIIQRGSRITNTRIVKNVKFGPYSIVEGADALVNGTINSVIEDRVFIGAGVICEDFIICSGSHIEDKAIISKSFIGQSCRIGKQFSVENSVFFANCEGFHSEACSVFAGPYTVTHHKSTLLIAGSFSFFNAGSGTNQSNHMYKLGPVHQGVTERGVKTGSNAYILWPAKVGAFSVVLGKHTKNSDTSDMPFSYLIEENGDSYLIPAINIGNVGVYRDEKKWKNRDRRKSKKLLDCINTSILNPYTIQKIEKAISVLKDFESKKTISNIVTYNRVKINQSSISNGIRLYEKALHKFMGDLIINKLGNSDIVSLEEIKHDLLSGNRNGEGKWIDLGGMLVPEFELFAFFSGIENQTITHISQINAFFESIHLDYENLLRGFGINHLQNKINKSIQEISVNDIISLLNDWKQSSIDIINLSISDAKKEFSIRSLTSYGLDGDEACTEFDFIMVRGDMNDNQTIIELKESLTEINKTADSLIEKLINIYESIDKHCLD